MKATYRIVRRTDFTKKDGTNPICLIVTINRKIKRYTLDVSCIPDHWNSEKSRIRKTHPDSENLNKLIDSANVRANKIIFDFTLNNKVLTFYDFEKEFYAPKFESDSFYSYVNYSIRIRRNTGKRYNPVLLFSSIKIEKIQATTIV